LPSGSELLGLGSLTSRDATDEETQR